MAKIITISAPLWQAHSTRRSYGTLAWALVAGMDDGSVRLFSLIFDKEARTYRATENMHMARAGDMTLDAPLLEVPRVPVTKGSNQLDACRQGLGPLHIAAATAASIGA